MAAAIRRLGTSLGWTVVVFIASLPLLGIIMGLWPTNATTFTDFTSLLTYQGLPASISKSLFTAIFSTLLSLYIAFMVYSQYQSNTRATLASRWLEKILAPLLSLPHLAIALGLVFLFSEGSLFFPEGNQGLPRKGLSTLIIAIMIKEVPFFLFIFIAIGRQLPIQNWLLQGRALGYAVSRSWWLLIFPVMLKQARLALLAASAYTLSVVDINFLIGPNIPELFAVSVYRWQTSFSPGDQALAFWANVMLLGLLALSIAILYAHEKMSRAVLRSWAVWAVPNTIARLSFVNRLSVVCLPTLGLLTLLMVIVFALRSFGLSWQTDTNIVASLHTQFWQDEWLFFALPLKNSVIIALCSSVLGVASALLALELQRKNGRYWPDYYWLLAILLPQLSMVLGWQISHIWLEGSYTSGWIVLSHLPFTFAYAYLVLKGPFQSIQPNYELLAASFGYSAWQRWWKVRFRLLLPAIFPALAITFSVSIAQYIPTLLIGAGRVSTITTEAVAIGTGNQQNMIGLYILLQSMLPFIAFLVAALLVTQVGNKSNMHDRKL